MAKKKKAKRRRKPASQRQASFIEPDAFEQMRGRPYTYWDEFLYHLAKQCSRALESAQKRMEDADLRLSVGEIRNLSVDITGAVEDLVANTCASDACACLWRWDEPAGVALPDEDRHVVRAAQVLRDRLSDPPRARDIFQTRVLGRAVYPLVQHYYEVLRMVLLSWDHPDILHLCRRTSEAIVSYVSEVRRQRPALLDNPATEVDRIREVPTALATTEPPDVPRAQREIREQFPRLSPDMPIAQVMEILTQYVMESYLTRLHMTILLAETEARDQAERVPLRFALFGATPFDGKTPLQLLVERQTQLSSDDQQRLLALGEPRSGLFEVDRLVGDTIYARDLAEDDREIAIVGADRMAEQAAAPGDLLMGDVLPWQDGYVVGTSLHVGHPGLSGADLEQRRELRDAAQKLAGLRDTSRQQQLRRKLHEEFVGEFGDASRPYPSARDAVESLRRFVDTRLKSQAETQIVTPDQAASPSVPLIGQTESVPIIEEKTPDAEPGQPAEQTDDAPVPTTLVSHPEAGVHVLPGLELFNDAVAVDEIDEQQAWVVQSFVRSPRVPPYIIEQAAEQDPERFERHLRRAFCDSSIVLDRDLPGMLRKYKCQHYRPELAPDMLTVLMPDLERLTGAPEADRPGSRIILPGES